ncbi:DUF418 domain-containing protein [Lacibacter cauensis]|nr:DUF418 domain-containing protein [Lacibacter cauensis]
MHQNSPLPLKEQTVIVDSLRGWALLSVVLMNYASIYGWNNHAVKTEPDALTFFLDTASELIFGSKGWTLLAVLFGFGFSVLLQNRQQSGQSVYWFFIKRMLWLFVFAFVNTLFFGGDILNDYALMGLLLLLFYKCSVRMLFVLAACVLLLTPLLHAYLGRLHVLFSPKSRDLFYSFYDRNTFEDHIKANVVMRYKWMLRLSYSVILHLIQLGCFLLGMALHRSHFFEQLSRYLKRVKQLFLFSFILSVAIYMLQFLIEKSEWTFNSYYNLYYPQILVIMCFTTTGIIWLYATGKAKVVFAALAITGKMTLTSYMLQNMLAFFFFILLKPNWSLQSYFLAGLVIYLLQVAASKWWLSQYQYGLAEWLWRCLSYGRMFPLKKKERG